nr:lamin tail domain-containing protein [Candidatus Sigynarchaeota archaeon]
TERPGYRVSSVMLSFSSSVDICDFIPFSWESYDLKSFVEDRTGFGSPVASTHNDAMGNVNTNITSRAPGPGVYDLVFQIVANDWTGFKSVKWHIDNVYVTVTYVSSVPHFINTSTRSGGNSMLNIANPVSRSAWSSTVNVPGISSVARINGTAYLSTEQRGPAMDGQATSKVTFSYMDSAGTSHSTALFELQHQYLAGQSFAIPTTAVLLSNITSWAMACNTTVPAISPDGISDIYHVTITRLEAWVQDGNGTWILVNDFLAVGAILTFTPVTTDGFVVQRQKDSRAVLSVLVDNEVTTSPAPSVFSATVLTPGMQLNMAPSKTTTMLDISYAPVMESATLSKAQLGGQTGTVTACLEVRGLKNGAYVPLYEQMIAEFVIDNNTDTSAVDPGPIDLSDIMGQSRWYDGQYVENYSISIHVEIIENCTVDDVKIGIEFSDIKLVCKDESPEPVFNNVHNGSVISGQIQSIIVQGQGDGKWCLFKLYIDNVVVQTYNDTSKGIPELWDWTLDTTKYNDTENAKIQAQICDENGQHGNSSNISVQIDNTVPTVQLVNITNNAVLGNAPLRIDIVCSDDVRSASYQIVPHGLSFSSSEMRVLYTDTTANDGFGFWLDVLTINEGLYDFRVVVTDDANLQGTDVVTGIIIELLNPAIISSALVTDGNTTIVAVSGSSLTSQATLAWALAEGKNVSSIPAIDWHVVPSIPLKSGDAWRFTITDSELGAIDGKIYWRVTFRVPGDYSEYCYASAMVDTISPAPALSWAPGSEPGAGNVFRSVESLNITMGGLDTTDLVSAKLYWHGAGEPADIMILSWARPAPCFTFSVPVSSLPLDSSGVLVLVAKDDVGREGVSSIDVIIDNYPPIISIYLPRLGQHVFYNMSTDESVNVSVKFHSAMRDLDVTAVVYQWRHVADASWTKFAPLVTSTRPGYYSFTWSIVNGSIDALLPNYQIRVIAMDIYGTTYETNVSFWIDAFQDTLAPYIVISQPQTTIIWGENIIFNFTAGDDNNVTQVSIWKNIPAPITDPYNTTNLVVSLPVVVDDRYYFELIDSAITASSGVYHFVVRALDQSFNTREQALDISIILPSINVTDGAVYQASGAGRTFAPVAMLYETDVDGIIFDLSKDVSGSWLFIGNQSTLFTGVQSGHYALRAHYRQNASIAGRTDAWYSSKQLITFTIDNSMPSDLSLAGIINSTTILTGMVMFHPAAYDDSGIATFKFFLNDTLIRTGAPNIAGISWTSTGYPEGNYILYFEATDTVNNSARSADYFVVVDNTKAVIVYQSVSGSSSINGTIYTTCNLTCGINVAEDVTVMTNVALRWVRLGDGGTGTAWSASPGSLSYARTSSISLRAAGMSDGIYLLRFVISSGAGVLISTRAWTVVLDNSPPACSFVFPQSNSIISGGTVTLVASIIDATCGIASVDFYLGSIVGNATRIGSGTLVESLGMYQLVHAFKTNYQGDIIAVAVDKAGNIASTTVYNIVLNYSITPSANISSGMLLGSPVTTSGPALPGTTVTLSYHEFTDAGNVEWVPLGSDTVSADETTFRIDWDTGSIISSGLESSWLPVRVSDWWPLTMNGPYVSGGGAGDFDGDGKPDIAYIYDDVSIYTTILIYEAVTPYNFEQVTSFTVHTYVNLYLDTKYCIGDADQDGKDELIFVIHSGDRWYLSWCGIDGSNVPLNDVNLPLVRIDTQFPAPVTGISEMICQNNNLYMAAGFWLTQWVLNPTGPAIVGWKRFSENIISIDRDALDTASMNQYLFFSTTRTFGYVEDTYSMVSSRIQVIDAVPDGYTISQMRVGDVDGDSLTDIMLGLTGSSASFIIRYSQSSTGEWTSSVVRRYNAPTTFSSLAVGVATGSADSIVAATSDNVKEIVFQTSTVNPVALTLSGSDNFVDTYKGLLDYRKMPVNEALSDQFAAREDLQTPLGQHTVIPSENEIQLTGDGRQASGRVGVPGTVTTDQGELIDSSSRLGFDQQGYYLGGQQEYFEAYVEGADIPSTNSLWSTSPTSGIGDFTFTTFKKDASEASDPRDSMRGRMSIPGFGNYQATYTFPFPSTEAFKTVSIALKISGGVQTVLLSSNFGDIEFDVATQNIIGVGDFEIDTWVTISIQFAASGTGDYTITATRPDPITRAPRSTTVQGGYAYQSPIDFISILVGADNSGQVLIDDLIAGWIDTSVAYRHQLPDTSGLYYQVDNSINTLADIDDYKTAIGLGQIFTATATTIDVVRVQPKDDLTGATIKLYDVNGGLTPALQAPILPARCSHTITAAEWHSVSDRGTIDFHVDFTGLVIGKTYAITFERATDVKLMCHALSPLVETASSSGHLIQCSAADGWSMPMATTTAIGTSEHPSYQYALNMLLIPDISIYRTPIENGVIINEIYAEASDNAQYIEIVNFDSESRNLNGWKVNVRALSGDTPVSTKLFDLAGLVLQAGRSFVLRNGPGINDLVNKYLASADWAKISTATDFGVELVTNTNIVADYIQTSGSSALTAPSGASWYQTDYDVDHLIIKPTENSPWCIRISDTDADVANDWAVKPYGSPGAFNAPFQDGKVIEYSTVTSNQDIQQSYERALALTDARLMDGDLNSGVYADDITRDNSVQRSTVFTSNKYSPSSFSQVGNPVDAINSIEGPVTWNGATEDEPEGWAIHYDFDEVVPDPEIPNAWWVIDDCGYWNGRTANSGGDWEMHTSSSIAVHDNSLHFDGDELIWTGIQRDLASYTFGAWVYPTELHNFQDYSGYPIMVSDTAGYYGIGVGISGLNGGTIHVLTPSKFVNVPFPMTENHWYFIATSIIRHNDGWWFEYDLQVFANGKLIYRDPTVYQGDGNDGSENHHYAHLNFGVDDANNRNFVGYMDDAFIVKGGLDASIIANLYGAGLYDFSSGAGAVAAMDNLAINTYGGNLWDLDDLAAEGNDDFLLLKTGSYSGTMLNFGFDLDQRIADVDSITEISISVSGFAVGYKLALDPEHKFYTGSYEDNYYFISGYYTVPIEFSYLPAGSGSRVGLNQLNLGTRWIDPADSVDKLAGSTDRLLWQKDMLTESVFSPNMAPKDIFSGTNDPYDDIVESPYDLEPWSKPGLSSRSSTISDPSMIQDILANGLYLTIDPRSTLASIDSSTTINYFDYRTSNIDADHVMQINHPYGGGNDQYYQYYDPYWFHPRQFDDCGFLGGWKNYMSSQWSVELPPAMIFLDQMYIEVKSFDDKHSDVVSEARTWGTYGDPLDCLFDVTVPSPSSLSSVEFEVYLKMPTTVVFAQGTRTSAPAGSFGKVRQGMDYVQSFRTVDDIYEYPYDYTFGTGYLIIHPYTPFYNLGFGAELSSRGLDGSVTAFNYETGHWDEMLVCGSSGSLVAGSSDVMCLRFTISDADGVSFIDDLRLGDNQGLLKLKMSVDMQVRWSEQVPPGVPGIVYDFDKANSANQRAFNTFDIYQSCSVTEVKTYVHSKPGVTFPGSGQADDGRFSEHQVVLDYPANALPFNFYDIQSVTKISINFDAMPTVSWFNYKDPSQTTCGYGYAGSSAGNIFGGLKFAFGVEIFDFSTSAWVMIVNPCDDSGQYITTSLSGMRIKAISAWRSRTLAFPLEHFVTSDEGLRLRLTCVVDWSFTDIYNFASLGFVEGVERAVKQTNFIVSGLTIDLEYKRDPAPMQITDGTLDLAASLTLPATTLISKLTSLPMWNSYASQVHGTGTLDLSVDLGFEGLLHTDISELDMDISIVRTSGQGTYAIPLVNEIDQYPAPGDLDSASASIAVQTFTSLGTSMSGFSFIPIGGAGSPPSAVRVFLTSLIEEASSGLMVPDMNAVIQVTTLDYESYWKENGGVKVSVPFLVTGLVEGAQYALVFKALDADGNEITANSDQTFFNMGSWHDIAYDTEFEQWKDNGYTGGEYLYGYPSRRYNPETQEDEEYILWGRNGLAGLFPYDLAFGIEFTDVFKHASIHDFQRGSNTLKVSLRIPDEYIQNALEFDPAVALTGTESRFRSYEIQVSVSNGMWNGYGDCSAKLTLDLPLDNEHVISSAIYYAGAALATDKGTMSKEYTFTIPEEILPPDMVIPGSL